MYTYNNEGDNRYFLLSPLLFLQHLTEIWFSLNITCIIFDHFQNGKNINKHIILVRSYNDRASCKTGW